MSHLGILLLSPHYPRLDHRIEKLPSFMSEKLGNEGHKIDKMSIFDIKDLGHRFDAEVCDVWVLSGSDVDLEAPLINVLEPFLHTAQSGNISLYALYHAEHILHDLLASPHAERPKTQRQIFCIRNPFFQTWKSDILHKFHPATGDVAVVH